MLRHVSRRFLNTNALRAADTELNRIAEFTRVQTLTAEDRLPAAREQIARALEFLQFAPKPMSLAANIRLARVEQGNYLHSFWCHVANHFNSSCFVWLQTWANRQPRQCFVASFTKTVRWWLMRL
jgi:hypothetical protein